MVEFLQAEYVLEKLTPVQIDDTTLYQEIHSIPPYWDFIYSMDQLGFDYPQMSYMGFHSIMESKYTSEYSKLRSAYLKRDLYHTRFWIHKFKGFFRQIKAKFFSRPCKNLQRVIQLDHSEEILAYYAESVAKIELFLEMIAKLGTITKNQVNQTYYNQFISHSQLFDTYEDLLTIKEVNKWRKLLKDPKYKAVEVVEKYRFLKDDDLYLFIQNDEFYHDQTNEANDMDPSPIVCQSANKKVCCSFLDCIIF